MKKNTVVYENNPYTIFASAKTLMDSTISYNQGDFLYLDTTNHLIKVVAAEANSATFLGVAIVSVASGKIASPYNTDVVASQAAQDVPGPLAGVTVKAILKTGDSINPGQKVGLDPATDARGVTVTITTSAIGVYMGPAIVGAAAGTEIEVYIKAVYF